MRPKTPKGFVIDRIKSEGKSVSVLQAHYEGLIKKGIAPKQALKDTLKHFGFESLKKETELYVQREKEKERLIEPIEVSPEFGITSNNDSLDEYIKELPESAKFLDEMNWVKNHHLMMRKTQQIVNSAGLVDVTVYELKQGKEPPSMSAVIMLQNFVNDPKKFYDECWRIEKERAKTSGDDQVVQSGRAVSQKVFTEDEILSKLGEYDLI